VSTEQPAGDPALPPGVHTALGGPGGARRRPLRRGPLAAVAPVVLLLGLPLTVAALRQSACTGPGWQGRTPIWRQCASPLISSLPADDLGRGLLAFLRGDVQTDTPPVAGSVTALLAGLAPGSGAAEQRWFLLLWMLLAAVLLVGVVLAVATVRRHPMADPVALALSPVLALTVLLSPDLVPVALAVVAVWAWSRDRVHLAGVLGGIALLGGAASAAVLLGMALVPGPRGRRLVTQLLVTAGGTVLVATALFAALDAGTLVRPVAAWWSDGAGPGSPWFIPTLAGHPVGAGYVAVISLLGMALAAALGVIVARQRPRPPVGDVVLLVLVVLQVTASALPISAGLWLVPFVALAGIRWRDHLLWAGAEWVHAVAYFTWLAGQTDPAHGLPAGWYATALSLRLLAVGRLGWVVWSRALWGEDPPARRLAAAPVTHPPPPDWVDARTAGTLERLPSEHPVDNPRVATGDDAYPPVTEGP
jgi:hypothetical protein